MRVRWLSHACFEISDGRIVLIDPYFKGNKLAPRYEGKPDIVLLTHEHFDHADTDFLSKVKPRIVVGPPSVRYPGIRVIRVGETLDLDGVKVSALNASHPQSRYSIAYLLEYGGVRLLHLGDTYLDAVKPLGLDVHLAFIPIGGTYTMNIDEAIEALDRIKPRLTIPMHFDTFPEIKADPEEFRRKAEAKGYRVRVLCIGESIEI
ncbi:MAG: MBL fold metallo-hydrolase [Nitrososphaerota archaeon]|nr:MBL fold metallo-hydrolase [Candidatus Bathyarchaeota archaeon]MCX8161996.1 MBL fold metallo-hydrolase [Candidatus Bathyarchaeota archaeon]MDW8061114.1 MBL fold metallo-hydrolase [Nitrososphaerota archaeon]